MEISKIENKTVNNLRYISLSMIEKANSGHPGIALSAAPILYTLYAKNMNVIPSDPTNIYRDRFVMSAGHGSSILYATLSSMGYPISMEDLKSFRKKGSITPGHPEYGVTPGVDCTTGPLGQGVATAVGLALAEKMMADRFNKPDIALFDNYTYALVGEGCLMEGVCNEALSLAGTLKLNKLIVLYDANSVTLDGDIKKVYDTDVMKVMQGYGFNTIEVKDGNSVEDIDKAIKQAKASSKPSFIKIVTHIGFGTSLQDSHKAHGSVMKIDEINNFCKKFDLTISPFTYDKNVERDLVLVKKRFDSVKKTIGDKIAFFKKTYTKDYQVLQSFLKNDYSNIEKMLADYAIREDMSGRDMGANILNKLASIYPNIVGGAADLSSSTKTLIKGSDFVNDGNFAHRNIKYGIREFAMGAISNGVALYGGFTTFSSTFFVFSDYMKNAVRLGAMMHLPSIYIFTHDSIAVGQDGPTHESVEQLAGFRAMPELELWRPGNFDETLASFVYALKNKVPSAIVLSRQTVQNVPTSLKDAMLGGYIASKENGKLDVVLLATGSELGLAYEAKSILKLKGYGVRIVSIPNMSLFDSQGSKYVNKVIPLDCKNIISIEAGSTYGWGKYVGRFGVSLGVDSFGLSATPEENYAHFGLTKEHIAEVAEKLIKKNK